jgi:hypothetical protein
MQVVGGVGYKIKGRRVLAAGTGVHFHRDEHLQDHRYYKTENILAVV